jgi:hypothetical protein
MGWTRRTHEAMKNVYKTFVRKFEMNKPLERRRHICEDNIKIDLKGLIREGVDSMHLVQGRDQWRDLVNMVMNFRFPLQTGNFLTS